MSTRNRKTAAGSTRHLTPETPLQISVSGQSLVISRADAGIGTEGVRNTTKRMRERYGQALKKLAE